MQKIKALFRLSLNNKMLLIESAGLLCFYKLSCTVLPPRYHFKQHLMKIETALVQDPALMGNISQSIERASRNLPWKSSCLLIALAARRMLIRRHIHNQLKIGVKKNSNNELKAHAWLLSNGSMVTGGSEDGDFHVIADFNSISPNYHDYVD